MSPKKVATKAARSIKKKPAASAPDGPTYAKMSSAAVEKATGKGWEEWLSILDRAGAKKLPHKEIAALLHEQHGVPGWWAQMVTVGYEQARGMREELEQPDGYSASASRVIAAPVADVWRAFDDSKRRAQWAGGARWTVSSATKEKLLHGRFEDGPTRIDVAFLAKGAAKTQVALQHRKLASQKDALARKTYWSERFDTLRGLLEGGAR